MKTEQILNLDFRKEENQEIIQKVLRKIKPLSKYSDEVVPIEAIEKLVRILVQKYEITPQWMTMSFFEKTHIIYSIGIKTTNDHKWVGTVYGSCLYEVFAKLAIKMYSEVRSGNIPVKTMTKEEKQREQISKQVDAKEDKDDY